MITEKQIQEIRDYINKAEKPLIFFDDDQDGLCSYLILKKSMPNAKGVIIKGSPMLDLKYLKKIDEVKPDMIFVLDKPLIDQELLDKINALVIWIDHHKPVKRYKVMYYNPRIENDSDNRPTTYWCYRIAKTNLLAAVIGSIADHHTPEYLEEFNKKFGGLMKDEKEPAEILYKTKLGELIRIYDFVLKGQTTDVKKSIKMLEKIETPFEVFKQETKAGAYIYKRYERVKKNYSELLKKALENISEERFFVFLYPSTKESFTGELAGELIYRFPEKIIIIGRKKDGDVRMSLRSKNIEIPPILEKTLVGIRGYGGGHKFACGANVAEEDFDRFVENIKKEVENLQQKTI